MEIGPVEYLIIAFPGNQFRGEIAPALAELIDRRTVRVLDLLFIRKDADGTTTVFEFDQLEEVGHFAALDGEAGGLFRDEDVDLAADTLEPDSSALLLLWEDTWAAPLAKAVRAAGGVIVDGARVPHDVVQEVFKDLPAAV